MAPFLMLPTPTSKSLSGMQPTLQKQKKTTADPKETASKLSNTLLNKGNLSDVISSL